MDNLSGHGNSRNVSTDEILKNCFPYTESSQNLVQGGALLPLTIIIYNVFHES